jgi:hypothetical protein
VVLDADLAREQCCLLDVPISPAPLASDVFVRLAPSPDPRGGVMAGTTETASTVQAVSIVGAVLGVVALAAGWITS